MCERVVVVRCMQCHWVDITLDDAPKIICRMHLNITYFWCEEAKDFIPNKEGSWDCWEGRVAYYYANTKFGVRRSHVEREIGRLSCARAPPHIRRLNDERTTMHGMVQ